MAFLLTGEGRKAFAVNLKIPYGSPVTGNDPCHVCQRERSSDCVENTFLSDLRSEWLLLFVLWSMYFDDSLYSLQLSLFTNPMNGMNDRTCCINC